MKQMNKQNSVFSYIVLTLSLALAGGLSYVGYRVAAAEYVFGRSIREAAANRGDATYNSQIQAIQLNPYDVRYRLSYAQTNLAIANSLAANKDLTDQDRQIVQQLVTQSIEQAKNAIAIDQLRADSWAVLANIYQSLINVAEGSDQWAVATYQQAIAVDPNNAQLRLAYGQLLFSLNEFEASQRQFELAVSLKQDYTNAFYNLAFAYSKQEKLLQAQSAMTQVLTLVERDSDDYKNAQERLTKINDLIAQNQPQRSAEDAQQAVVNPTPTSKPVLFGPEEATNEAFLEPPLELDEKSAAPNVTVVPTKATQ